MARFLSQDATQGALPTLRAATESDAAQGSYYGPGQVFGLKGDPVPVSVPKPAQDEAVARRLWDVSEKLTGYNGSMMDSRAPPLETTAGVGHPPTSQRRGFDVKL